MLGDAAVASVLHAVATGFTEDAVDVVTSAEDLDEVAREMLLRALTEDQVPSAQARRLGDGLRALNAPWDLISECYRASFYAGEDWKRLSTNPLFAYFASNRSGSPIDKWPHYFPIYDRHLERFRGLPVRVLEIGAYRGGGLEMLRHYLGPAAVIVGIDIDQDSARVIGSRFIVEVGDQADASFLRRVTEQHGPWDIVIDDGGHRMHQQISAVEALFPLLKSDGVYIVEDCHTSYWPEYADPSGNGRTFLGWVRDRIDDINAYHYSSDQTFVDPWRSSLSGLHVYDSVVVLDNAPRFPPFNELSGTSDFIRTGRSAQSLAVEVDATRDARDAAVAARDTAVVAREAALVELGELRQRLGSLEVDFATASTELDRAREVLRSSLGTIEEMRDSTSWRVTEPLRRIGSILRG